MDWQSGRVKVRSPKTEHHAGGDSRMIPLFPELREHLATGPVITHYRSTNVNLRTQLLRIIAKAGLRPWPKLFQNLRSSRETGLRSGIRSTLFGRGLGIPELLPSGIISR